MKKQITFLAILLATVFFCFSDANAQLSSDVYDQGSLWNISTIRIDANQGDTYLRRLKQTWQKSMEMAKAEGLILSYKILYGQAANEDDYNLMLMIEFKDYAQYDPDPERDAKWQAIQDKVVEEMSEELFDETVAIYDELREFMGAKDLREIYLK